MRAKKTTKPVGLTKGCCYKKADIKTMFGGNKDNYLCATIGHKKYRNELHKDGLVHDPRIKSKHLEPSANHNKVHHGRPVFVQFNAGDYFEYAADEDYMVRWDQTRVKIFFR